jgi:chromosome segregation ATPase
VQELTASSRDRSDLMEKYRSGMSVEQGRLQTRVRELERQLQARGSGGRDSAARDADASEAKQQLAKLEEKYRSAMRSLSRTTDEVAALQRRCADLEPRAEEHEQCVAELASAGVPGAPELLVRLSGTTKSSSPSSSSSSPSARGAGSADTRTLRDIIKFLIGDHEACMAELSRGLRDGADAPDAAGATGSSNGTVPERERRVLEAAGDGRPFSVRLSELASARQARCRRAIEALRADLAALREAHADAARERRETADAVERFAQRLGDAAPSTRADAALPARAEAVLRAYADASAQAEAASQVRS